jgi:hypothetical protein
MQTGFLRLLIDMTMPAGVGGAVAWPTQANINIRELILSAHLETAHGKVELLYSGRGRFGTMGSAVARIAKTQILEGVLRRLQL